MAEFSEFVSAIEERMRRGRKFRISRDVRLPDGSTASLTASRTYFSWKGLGILSQHILITDVENPTVEDSIKLFEAGFRYAKKINRVPLLRGMQFGYMIVPCIASTTIGEALVHYASATPQKHWSLFEFPVFYDLSSNEIHYFRGTPLWGALFFSDLRNVVREYIA